MKNYMSSLAKMLAVLAVAVGALLPGASHAASNLVGPGGVNVGFDFNWSPGPAGYTATFIASSGSSGGSLNTCIGVCNFAIAYSVGGVPQASVLPGGAYETWIGANNTAGRFCDTNNGSTSNNTAPLTAFNCFNANSFGQNFTPTTSGLLSNMTMPMTCLNPAGGPITGLFALIYQVTGNSIPATPIAQVPVDLSTCPTLSDWQGHTFSSADFVNIPLDFSGVNLVAGTTYGVYFGGLMPGSSLPGYVAPPVAEPAAVPTMSTAMIAVLALGLLALGLGRVFRSRA